MERKHNPKLTQNARALRKNMTREDRILWYEFLRNYPVRFRRQKIMGRYIVDFYCASANLVIELDGSQHFEDAGLKKDATRTASLEQFGVKVLRIANNEITENLAGVSEYIDLVVKAAVKKQTAPDCE
ncbi:MAG: endonuclease domain-containing protein [Clostridia bacterium]|nr:endonuclease domain-containing protein [Clostridia bacterium]